MVTPAMRREALAMLNNKGLSKRMACRITGIKSNLVYAGSED
jgi:hypothetical protein